MKRCPQCEFIYEDEQNICDMDGTMLAFDASSTADSVKQSPLRSFAIPALVGSMLAALLFLGFYASPLLVASPDARSRPAEAQTSPVGSPIPEPTATQPAGAQPSPHESPGLVSDGRRSEQAAMSAVHDRKDTADSRLAVRRDLPLLPRVPSLPRLPPARVGKQGSSTARDKNRDHVQLTSREPKKSSKVGLFLKKTGRIIKKPFKL
jgi:hypothetical protein